MNNHKEILKDSMLGRIVCTHEHKGTGKTGSCRSCANIGKNRRHGMSGTRFHNIWWAVQQRCRDKNSSSYYNYGGVGVDVCERWQTFDFFMEDMHGSYIKHVKKHGESQTTLDRKDGELGYSPKNCRWATRLIQGNNTRRNLLITHKGRTETCATWARELGMKPNTLKNRIMNLKWSHEKAIETPVRKKK